MQEFIKHFRRESADTWACLEPAELTLPSGRIQVTAGSRFVRGTKFMGVDLAELLEAAYQGRDGR
ncbi:MAG TPA: hypothetical protein VK043_09890 [Burkholderiales bacterium]|nr:hypothetical protein [Burkholderiales bacterium]